MLHDLLHCAHCGTFHHRDYKAAADIGVNGLARDLGLPPPYANSRGNTSAMREAAGLVPQQRKPAPSYVSLKRSAAGAPASRSTEPGQEPGLLALTRKTRFVALPPKGKAGESGFVHAAPSALTARQRYIGLPLVKHD